jgi:DNA-binding MarR family transcriptional regulator
VPRRLPFDPIAEAGRLWEVHWGPEAVPSMLAVTSIMRAQQILLGRLNELLKPLGLTFPRYEALMLLYYSRRGSLPLGIMGERLQVHRASVTNVIDRLEAQGLVRRVPHSSDRRGVLAELTHDGRVVAKEATERLNLELFGLASLDGEQLHAVFGVLRPLRVDADDFAP